MPMLSLLFAATLFSTKVGTFTPLPIAPLTIGSLEVYGEGVISEVMRTEATVNAQIEALVNSTSNQWQAPAFAMVPVVHDDFSVDTPADYTHEASQISEVPACPLRIQTVSEIQRIRMQQTKLASRLEQEKPFAQQRRLYVEQMTAYLNKKIMELNQIKEELKEEARFIAKSEGRIKTLNERQKLIKMHDILGCLSKRKSFETAERNQRDVIMKNIMESQKTINANIVHIEKDVAAKEQMYLGNAMAPKAAKEEAKKHHTEKKASNDDSEKEDDSKTQEK
eukprot:jgi/Bigna1/89239/estExt_fgenesh1_pg.C_460011